MTSLKKRKKKFLPENFLQSKRSFHVDRNRRVECYAFFEKKVLLVEFFENILYVKNCKNIISCRA